jgi:hypothetical protein
METPCACGCGQIVTHKELEPSRLLYQGPKRFIAGHQNRGRKHTTEHIAKTRKPMELNGRWKGGRMIDGDGYILIKHPDHPAARQSGYVLEHRLVMERKLGRLLLDSEIVHHKNAVKSDNTEDNLELLVGQSDHMKLERTGKKFPRKNGIWFTCLTCSGAFYRSAYWKDKPVHYCSWSCRYPH